MIGLMIALLAQAAPTEQQHPPLPPLHGGPAPMTCPVGGETFEGWRAGVYSTYGRRPDGRPYSYLRFPLPIPECPGNRLVVFDSFTPAEMKRLTTLIASPAYRALIADDDTAYYRAFWLADALGRPADQVMGLLLSATWEVKEPAGAAPRSAARAGKARAYQQMFVRRARALPAATPAETRSWILLRAANALRELGQFAHAETMRRQAAAASPDQDAAAKAYFHDMATVIARHDPSVEPLDLIPPQQARFVCEHPPATMSAADRQRCATPPLAMPTPTGQRSGDTAGPAAKSDM